MNFKTLLPGLVGLMILTGCNTLQDTTFAPVDVQLESDLRGGEQHIILVNASGQELHHFTFRGSVWGDSPLTYTGDPLGTLPQHVPNETYTFNGSGGKWEPGQALHFRERDLGIEGRVLRPVTRVQIVGHCDEGSFREDWQMTRSGQLQRIGAE
jgi:hypothetical protein